MRNILFSIFLAADSSETMIHYIRAANVVIYNQSVLTIFEKLDEEDLTAKTFDIKHIDGLFAYISSEKIILHMIRITN